MCTTEKWYKDCCYWNMKKGLTGECLPKSKKQYHYFFTCDCAQHGCSAICESSLNPECNTTLLSI